VGMIKLKDALRLSGADQIAFVGAGGKTSAIFHLASQIDGPVLVSSSTHLSAEQSSGTDKHIILNHREELSALFPDDLPGITLFTGPEGSNHRLAGLDEITLRELSAIAHSHNLPLLIEADGSKQLPLKAPAEHEPALPDFVDIVIVVAGLSALGVPLEADTVHRPEQFAKLSDSKFGKIVNVGHLEKVLSHPKGGLKNIPSNARKVLLLNQVESDEFSGAAKGLAARLLPSYQAVLAAAISPADGIQSGVSAAYERVGGVLLAAGGSQRLGEAKQLLDWRGKSFVRQIAETAIEAGISPLVVVTGAYQNEVAAELTNLPVEIVVNPDWQSGQSSSVRAGLAALPEDLGAAAFLVVDQPQLSASLLEALMAEHARSLAPIISPQVDGQRSNPVLFDRSTFPDFESIEGDQGGRAIFSRHQVTWIPWLDASLAIDVDTIEDYQRLLSYED